MAKKVNKDTRKQLIKNLKVDIRKRMEDALADFKAGLGEKKFNKRLKKASAIFSDGIALDKKAEPLKKQKKKAKKETAAEEVAEATA